MIHENVLGENGDQNYYMIPATNVVNHFEKMTSIGSKQENLFSHIGQENFTFYL